MIFPTSYLCHIRISIQRDYYAGEQNCFTVCTEYFIVTVLMALLNFLDLTVSTAKIITDDLIV